MDRKFAPTDAIELIPLTLGNPVQAVAVVAIGLVLAAVFASIATRRGW